MFKFLSKLAGLEPKEGEDAPPDDSSESAESAPPEAYSPEVVDQMAAEMSPKQGVDWATKSGDMVKDQLPPEDVAGLEAAKSWQANPTPRAARQAKRTAMNAGHQGPGAWAAQAAALAGEAAAAGTPLTAAGSPDLLAKSVAGAVKLAAATTMEAPPPADGTDAADATQTVMSMAGDEAADAAAEAVDPAQHAKALKPFIDLGKQIMNGGAS